ncbi:MAG: hypothetical protein FJ197_01065 [Gammaproteobacteria bacterium]|nr:hypothetical protein [Gammaproteobacteria bacterium]
MTGHVPQRKTALFVLALAAAAALAEDAEIAPSPELLEFLGDWVGEESGEDWIGLLDLVLRNDGKGDGDARIGDAEGNNDE